MNTKGYLKIDILERDEAVACGYEEPTIYIHVTKNEKGDYVLYPGKSINFRSRTYMHKNNTLWWDDIRFIITIRSRFINQGNILEVEKRAIRILRMFFELHNTQHNTDPISIKIGLIRELTKFLIKYWVWVIIAIIFMAGAIMVRKIIQRVKRRNVEKNINPETLTPRRKGYIYGQSKKIYKKVKSLPRKRKDDR